MLRKVISGGQNGVDQAALRAAKKCGFATGGWAPKGFRTLDGGAPWLGTDYGLQEGPVAGYPWWTSKNVLEADATLRIARDLCSAGERATLRYINKHKKPHLDVKLPEADKGLGNFAKTADGFARFIIAHNVRVLNVAGNSEGTAPGIGAEAEYLLEDMFRQLFLSADFLDTYPNVGEYLARQGE